MERELLSLSMFLIAAATGAARFRSRKTWDDVSLWISLATNFFGTALLTASLLHDRQPAVLVPLSLLVLMHGTAFLYKNHFLQIFGLPLVIGELLLSLTLSSIQDVFAHPVFLLAALILHTGFVAASFRWLLHLPRVTVSFGPSWNPHALADKLAKHTRTLSSSWDT